MSDPNPNAPGTPPTPDKPAEGITAQPETRPATTVTPTPAPVPAPAAPKPAAPAAKGPPRRIFLVGTLFGSWIAAAWTTMTAAFGIMTLGTVRFLYPNVLTEPPNKFKAGFPDNFEEGKV